MGGDAPRALVQLGGLLDFLPTIRQCRRAVFVACGTSYHACMACRPSIEQLARMPVRRLSPTNSTCPFVFTNQLLSVAAMYAVIFCAIRQRQARRYGSLSSSP